MGWEGSYIGKSSPKAPAAPDPQATANAQAAANKDTAITQAALNRINQYSPYGSVTFSQTGGGPKYNMDAYNSSLASWQKAMDAQKSASAINPETGRPYGNQRATAAPPPMPTMEQFRIGSDVPQYSQTTSFSPEQQRIYDLTTGLQEQALGIGKGVLGNVSNAVSKPFSLEGLPKAPGSGDFTADRDLVVNALLDRNQPQMDRSRSALEAKLANQGITVGSEAFRKRMDDINRQENDFRLAALTAGGAEQSRLFGLADTSRKNALQEMSFERSQPINEYAALLGLGGGVSMPQFTPFSQVGVQPTDVMGPINTQYQGQLANFNAQNSAKQSTMGNLFGLAGAGLGGWAGIPAGGAAIAKMFA